MVQDLISWRQSFRRLSEEYETVSKKRKALDNLLADGRISQPTHDLFDTEIDEATAEIEKQQRMLQEKMDSRMGELADQVKTLEILLANFELQHVTGEVDEQTYQREIDVLSMGLETARQELEAIKEASDQVLKGNITLLEHPSSEPVVVSVQEKSPEPVVEFVQVEKTEDSSSQEEKPQETLQATDKSESSEPKQAEEKQEA
jgi:hypothetical protein